MCFRPPTIDFAEIECPECGALIPMDSEECPECGVVIALNAAAPPAVQMAPPVMAPPKAPGARPKAPAAAPKAPPRAPAAPARAARDAEPEAAEIRVPVVGGRIRMPAGMEPADANLVPEVPAGPGFEEAPDISNTGNYFTSGVYNNG